MAINTVIIGIWGPPGSGKTTLIRFLAQQGLATYDLEFEADTDSRYKMFNALSQTSSKYLYLGMADIQIDRAKRPNLVSVLLLPSKVKYHSRRLARDESQPEKKDQPDVYDAFASLAKKNAFNMVLANNGTVEEAAVCIAPNLKGRDR